MAIDLARFCLILSTAMANVTHSARNGRLRNLVGTSPGALGSREGRGVVCRATAMSLIGVKTRHTAEADADCDAAHQNP